jgi:hypothetical protein
MFNLVDQGTRPDADISTKQARKATFRITRSRWASPASRGRSARSPFQFTVAPGSSGFSDSTRVLNFRRPTPVAREQGVEHPEHQRARAGHSGDARGSDERRGGLTSSDLVANPVPTDVRNAGRDFAIGVFFAQISDNGAGRLDDGGALGGRANLSTFPFTWA